MVWDKSARTDGTFGRSDLAWDQEANVYHCPGDRLLHGRRRVFANLTSAVTKAETIYRASQADCQSCGFKVQCCPDTLFRTTARSIHEDARDLVRRFMGTPQYQQPRCERKKVEMLFAHLKLIIKLDRLRLRGPTVAHEEFLLAATAQNSRGLAKRLCSGMPQLAKSAG